MGERRKREESRKNREQVLFCEHINDKGSRTSAGMRSGGSSEQYSFQKTDGTERRLQAVKRPPVKFMIERIRSRRRCHFQ
jgi:hypothetical protein